MKFVVCVLNPNSSAKFLLFIKQDFSIVFYINLPEPSLVYQIYIVSFKELLNNIGVRSFLFELTPIIREFNTRTNFSSIAKKLLFICALDASSRKQQFL